MDSILEITIQRRVEGVWPVVAEHHRSGTLLPVRGEGRLALAAEPATMRPRAYGTALGQALFSGEVRRALDRAHLEGADGSRIWVCVEDPALKAWRWDWLCGPTDGGQWDFLRLDQRTLYSLYIPSLTDRPYPPIGRHDLRALILVANPADPAGRYGLTAFDSRRMVERLRSIFATRCPGHFLAAAEGAIGPPKLDALVEQLTAGTLQGPFSILHLVCHGRFQPQDGETVLYLEGVEQGTVHPLPATELLERLARVRQLPHLIFLSVCESGTPAAELRLGSFAHRLVRELGIPAVVAMTEPVTVQTAQALAESFYERLLGQSAGAVDRALAEACAGLARRPDIHVPAIYSRLGGSPLFSEALDRPLTPSEIRAALLVLQNLIAERAPALLSRLTMARQELTPWLATEAADLSPAARQARERVLESVNELCQEAVDLSFHALATGAAVPAYDARQPFRGLSPFRAEDREFFFGRDRLVALLLRKLQIDSFLPVLGPSGSGKSSLVLAGLVPILQDCDGALQVAYLTPGANPLDQLRARQDALGPGPAVYVIDQFEEVFTACRDEVERRVFIQKALDLAESQHVIVTMRADFWGECAPHSALKDRMLARQELIAPLTTPELRSAVEQQAAKVGLRFEADLSHTILDEVAGEPGAMPLLQHALLELWKRRHGRWLRSAEYREIGGVRRAIAETADRLYEDFAPGERERTRDILLRLTQLDEMAPGEERRGTRRRVPVGDLIPAGSVPEDTKVLVKRLADAALVVTGWNPVSQQEEVEVAHEALIRHWGRLGRWLDEDHEHLRLRDSVAEASHQWSQQPADPSLLVHRGSRLEAAEALLGSSRFPLTARECRYLSACRSQQDAELEAARISATKLRWRATLVTVFAVALAVACTLLYLSRRTAVRDGLEARARYWATEASRLFTSDPTRALKLAALAMRTAPPETAAYGLAQGTLWNLLGRSGGQAVDYGPKLITARVSDDGRFLVMGGGNGIVLHDLTKQRSLRLAEPCCGARIWFLPKSHWAVIASIRFNIPGLVCGIDVEAGLSRTAAIECDEQQGTVLAVDPKGRWLLVGRESGMADFYTLPPQGFLRPHHSLQAHATSIVSAEFSADGNWLATGSNDGLLRLWNLRSGLALDRTTTYRLVEGQVSALTFHSKRQLLFAASGFELDAEGYLYARRPSVIRLWDLRSGLLEDPLRTEATSLHDVRSIIAAGSYVAVFGPGEVDAHWGSWQQRANLQLFTLDPRDSFDTGEWGEPEEEALQAPEFTSVPSEGATAYSAALLSADAGKWLAVAYEDGHLEIRAMDDPRGIVSTSLWAHRGPVWSTLPTRDGFVTAGADGKVRLWIWGTEKAMAGSALPLPEVRWSAAEIRFTSQEEFVVRHGQSGMSSLWRLSPAGIFVRRDGPAKKTEMYLDYFRDGSPVYTGELLSTAPTRRSTATRSARGVVLRRDSSSLQLCRSGGVVECGQSLLLATTDAFLTEDGTAVVASRMDRRCPVQSRIPCRTREQRRSVTVWRLKIDGLQLAIEDKVEGNYDLALQTSEWMVLVTNDPGGAGGVYRLGNGPGLNQLMALPHFKGVRDAEIVDGRWLILGTWGFSSPIWQISSDIYLADLAARAPLETLKLISLEEEIVAMRAGRGKVYFGLDDGSISVLDLDSASLEAKAMAHEGGVSSIALSADGSVVASGGQNGEIKTWTMPLQSVASVHLFSHPVSGLAFSPGQTWLAASAQGEAPRVFSLNPTLLGDWAERIAARPFTPEEVKQYGTPPAGRPSP